MKVTREVAVEVADITVPVESLEYALRSAYIQGRLDEGKRQMHGGDTNAAVEFTDQAMRELVAVYVKIEGQVAR